MNKLLISLILIVINKQVFALDWIGEDGSGSCGTSLQVCVNSASDGDVVNVKFNGQINETILLTQAVSLIAADGFNPKFSAGNNIIVQTDGDVTIKGFIFLNGKISVTHQGSEPSLYNILNNTINFSTSSTNEFALSVSSAINEIVGVSVNINYNQIVAGNEANGIYITNSNDGVEMDVKIYGNTIKTEEGKASEVLNESSNTIELAYLANKLFSGGNGLTIINSGNVGEIQAAIISNLIDHPDSSERDGILVENINSSTGIIDLSMINNTILNGFIGILTIDRTGVIDAEFYNNLLAHSTYYGFYFQMTNGLSNIRNDYNLTFDIPSHLNYSPGTNVIVDNPQLDAFNRLTRNSAAIDAGYSLVLSGLSLPYVDADGLHREKDGNGDDLSNVDIGAFEFGSISFSHKHQGPDFIRTEFDNSSTNGLPYLKGLHVTSIYKTEESSGMYNNDNFELFYNFGPRWSIRNTGGVNIESEVAFNIINIPKSPSTFSHKQLSSPSSYTNMSHSGLDGMTNKILQVTQNREFFDVDNPHPIGVFYDSGNWNILNLDSQYMPLDTTFNVYFQDKSQSAWEHIATSDNINFHISYISHPLLNGNECAKIQVTQKASYEVQNNIPIGVSYEYKNQQWVIFNQKDLKGGFVPMPIGAAFHVLIDPAQIDRCNDVIYKNGFDQ